ncbi:MAG: hypothetical protein P4N59_13220 [Negativicutes bacterium]|nr:hypothetical protein [Negativicutes bacterium]
MVKDEAREVTFIKNYRNIMNLSSQQLTAIKTGDSAQLRQCIAQKQIIIDYIKKSQVDSQAFQPAVIEEARQLLTDIAAIEEESQKLLNLRQDTARVRLVASRQAKVLRQAYEAPLLPGRIVNRSK